MAVRAAMQQAPSASYTSTLRVKVTNRPGTLGELTIAIGRAGADKGDCSAAPAGPEPEKSL